MWAKSKQDLKLPERCSSLSPATVLGEDAPANEKLPSGVCGGHSDWRRYEMLHHGGSSRARSLRCAGDHPLPPGMPFEGLHSAIGGAERGRNIGGII